MIRKCLESELEIIYEIINDSAVAYKDRNSCRQMEGTLHAHE